MANWITLYEVFYIILFILAFVLFLHQLYITVAKEYLLLKKCWKGSTTHPIDEWTFEVACQQIVDILQKQMNCDNPQLPQMWIQKCICRLPVCLTICSLSSFTKWHPIFSLPVPCRDVLSRGCLVAIKRGFLFCFVLFVYRIRWGMPYFLPAKRTCLRQKLEEEKET